LPADRLDSFIAPDIGAGNGNGRHVASLNTQRLGAVEMARPTDRDQSGCDDSLAPIAPATLGSSVASATRYRPGGRPDHSGEPYEGG
jgi:hypothetical protein